MTVSKEGELIKRYPVTTKLAIGLAPSGSRNFPERLDHFVLLRQGAEKGSWVPDEVLMAHYAPKCKHEVAESCEHCCRTIRILLMDDDISNVFPHELAWWSRSGKKCWGDGEKAMRRVKENEPAVEWTPCRNAGCPDWDKDCSGSGDLRFCLADYPVVGSICRIHTSSLRSIENIHSALTTIQDLTKGRLAGITVPLSVNMCKTTYMDNGKPKSSTVPILSIHSEVTDLIKSIKETAELWGTASKAFGSKLLIEDDDEQRAAEIPPEFPRKEEQKALPEAPQKTEPPKPVEDEKVPIATAHRQSFDGMPSKITEDVVPSGKSKGSKYWRVKVDGFDNDFILETEGLHDIVVDAIKRATGISMSCEVLIGKTKRAFVAKEVSLLAKEPEPPTEPESPTWMLE